MKYGDMKRRPRKRSEKTRSADEGNKKAMATVAALTGLYGNNGKSVEMHIDGKRKRLEKGKKWTQDWWVKTEGTKRS